MREMFSHMKEKMQLKSILLIFMLVATSMAVVFPLTAPKVRAQVIHLATAYQEDLAGLPYDISPVGDGVVIWNASEDHIISDPLGYFIEDDMTLNIPVLNYVPDGFDDPNEHEITFQGLGNRIDVYGTLITNSDGLFPPTRTAFLDGGFGGWDGIYFHPGSEGRIYDTLIRNAANGVVFEPGSKLMAPGIYGSSFEDYGYSGLRMDGVSGSTNIERVQFDAGSSPSANISLDVANGNLDMYEVFFLSHGPGEPILHISNASVNIENCQFNGDYQPGSAVIIEDGSNGTVLDRCLFIHGAAGDHYVRVDGSSNLIANSRFETTDGALTIIANENVSGIPAHPVILNPTGEGAPGIWSDTFDNSTMNVTGNSSVTLEWYMDVYVDDPNGNPIDNAPVWVNDSLGNPAEPPSKTTDASGWARGFIVTELIQYNNSIDNFNPFNVSAQNKTYPEKGYALPEPIINKSTEVTVTVPFTTVINYEPNVTWITTPVGVQSGLVTVQYKIVDLNEVENGSLSAQVYWTTDGTNWYLATQGGGDSLTGLRNNTVYTFIWDSDTESGSDLSGVYNTTVQIKIVPYDGYGEGISNETDHFTVDNKGPPIFLSGPFVTPSNTTALIEWTVDELANATVWWGIEDTLTDETTNNSMTMTQSVTLTNLQPGRRYTYVINSTDLQGLTTSSHPTTDVFFTEVHIQLYEGWNMISVLPIVNDDSLGSVLATIAGDWDTVWVYDASDPIDPWKLNDTGNPSGSDLHNINEEMGVWIHMINDSVLIVDHTVPDPDPPYTTSIVLYPGWNLVGYPSVTTRTVTGAMKDLFGGPITFNELKTYDAATGQWLSYDGGAGALTVMEMGRGYWIHVPDYYLWVVNYV